MIKNPTKIISFSLLLFATELLGTTVDTLNPAQTFIEDEWNTFLREGGTAEIKDLTGLGGNLEGSQPLPNSAVKLTTRVGPSGDPDGAEIQTALDYGFASSVLTSINLGYDYHKAFVAGGNASAAPALKLSLFTAGGTGDSFGQLIFEPTWNGGPTTNSWTSINIDQNTGSGSDATGGWWWTGGFEIGSGGGGPPIRSLAEWAAAFTISDPTDFANAHVIGLGVGVGTNNQGQIGYVDNVRIATGNINKTYDFETRKGNVPDNGSMIGLLSASFLCLLAFRRAFKKSS